MSQIALYLGDLFFEPRDDLLLLDIVLLEPIVLLVCHLQAVVFGFKELHLVQLNFESVTLGGHFGEVQTSFVQEGFAL